MRRPRKGKNNDKAHPPIHPLKAGNDLTGRERLIYSYIAKRFIAGVYDDAKYSEKAISVSFGGEIFHISGNKLLAKNYLEVFTYDKFTYLELPDVAVGSNLTLESLLMKTGETSAPKLLTETELITTMDKNGIGTDATIHEHIKRVVDRGYAEMISGRFKPTGLGIGLVLSYDKLGMDVSLTQPAIRARTESSLQQICDGLSAGQVLGLYIDIYKRVFSTLIGEIDRFVAMVSYYMTQNPNGSVGSATSMHNMRTVIPAISERHSNRLNIPASSERHPILSANRLNSAPVDEEDRCDCGLICKIYTSQKEQSKGKRFACCSKTVYRCKYFKWL